MAHAFKIAPGSSHTSTVHTERAVSRPDRSTFLLDHGSERSLKHRFRVACDLWKRRNDGTRAQFADALEVSELSVKQWLSSDESRPVSPEMVALAERLAAESAAELTPEEVGRAQIELWLAQERVEAYRRRVVEAA